MNNWISVEDHLPEDGTMNYASNWIDASVTPPEFPCIAYNGDKAVHGNYIFIPKGILTIRDEQHGEWCMDADLAKSSTVIDGDEYSAVCYENRITHWMPLPSPPVGC